MPCIPLRSLLTGSVGGVSDPFTWEQRKENLREGYSPSSPIYNTRLSRRGKTVHESFHLTRLLSDTAFVIGILADLVSDFSRLPLPGHPYLTIPRWSIAYRALPAPIP